MSEFIGWVGFVFAVVAPNAIIVWMLCRMWYEITSGDTGFSNEKNEIDFHDKRVHFGNFLITYCFILFVQGGLYLLAAEIIGIGDKAAAVSVVKQETV